MYIININIGIKQIFFCINGEKYYIDWSKGLWDGLQLQFELLRWEEYSFRIIICFIIVERNMVYVGIMLFRDNLYKRE